MQRLTTLLICAAVFVGLAACQSDENAGIEAPAKLEAIVQTETVEPSAVVTEAEVVQQQEEVSPADKAIVEPRTPQAIKQAAVSQPSDTYREGVHYLVLPQLVRTSDPERIEVVEMFWYGCGHCYDFEHIISKWEAQQPEDVVFEPTPVTWHSSVVIHARAFYTAKALKVLDKVHVPIFEAMNLRKQKLQSEAEIADLFVAQGVDRDKFSKTFNSFGINSALKQAESRLRAYGTDATPELIINGKYRVTTRMAGGLEGMLEVASFLIEKERKQ